MTTRTLRLPATAAGRDTGPIGRVFRAAALWQRRRKAIAELRSLSDRMLEDIGIQRENIAQMVDGLMQAKADDLGRVPSSHQASSDLAA